MVCETYIFIDSNLLSYKNWKQNKKISNTAILLLIWVKFLVLKKNANFLQKIDEISKIREGLVLEGILFETTYVCVFTYQMSAFWHNSNEF